MCARLELGHRPLFCTKLKIKCAYCLSHVQTQTDIFLKFSFILIQGVEPYHFSGSGSVWVQQRFQISVQFRLRFKLIETLWFGFAPVKNISKSVYKVPVQVRSKE